MAKKSKKIKRIMTVKLPKPEAPSAVENVVGSLASLQASTGWALIVKILNDNISYLEQAIINKIDPLSKEPLTEKEVEEARLKRSLSIDLRETPANYSKQVKDTGEVPEEFDPYFKTMSEVLKAKSAQPVDDRG